MIFFTDTLYTNRLILRKVTLNDLSLLADWSHSTEAHGKYLTPAPFRLSDLKDQWKNGTLWSPRSRTFLIEKKHCNTPIGVIHHWQKEAIQTHTAMALKIASPHERGKGYGTEAQKFLTMHLMNHCGTRIIDMHTDIGNIPQQRCLEKLGFANIKSGEYQDQQIMRTGFLYRLTQETFMSQPIYRYHYE